GIKEPARGPRVLLDGYLPVALEVAAGRPTGGEAEERSGRCVDDGDGVCSCAPPCLVAAGADHQRVRLAVDAPLQLASVGQSCRPRAAGERVCGPTRSQRFPAPWPV